jgi:uncharacterized membrane protein YidH (DUF202 family)
VALRAGGVFFALYGVAVIAYGSRRRGVVERALEGGRYFSGVVWELVLACRSP